MPKHKVLLLCLKDISALGAFVSTFFEAETVISLAAARRALDDIDYRVVVFDSIMSGTLDLEVCIELLRHEKMSKIPLVVLSETYSLPEKLKAFEIGCDDFIDASITHDEACARVTKSVFNQIAQNQLSQRLDVANQTAFLAMANNSDLGANIQFLLAVHDCDNLDDLGQQLFRTIQRYGLHCSLQMRSLIGVKNMEAHGMAKDLESQLLTQLADSKRYIDFGNRTIVNYDGVSLLIKNMPVGDSDKYGSIKENAFCLLQGVNARIIALEDQYTLLHERESLRKLTHDVGIVMNSLKGAYQKVMCDIVTEVENTAELIQGRVPNLALTLEDEVFLESTTNHAISATNRVFNEGLVVDETFAKLECAIENSLAMVEEHSRKSGRATTTTTHGDELAE